MRRVIPIAAVLLATAAFFALPLVQADPIQGQLGGSGIASTRTISTTAPLTGGGDLSADRTFAMPAATASVNGYMTSVYATKIDGMGAGANAIGAASSTDNTIARWDGTGGKTIQASGVTIDDSNLVGLGTSAPTHSLTMSSTATGFALYGTADQTTNYERLLVSMVSNVPTIAFEKGGSGSARAIKLLTNAGASGLTIDSSGGGLTIVGSSSNQVSITPQSSTVGILLLGKITTGTVAGHQLDAGNSYTASSGTQTHVKLTATANQTSTAGFDALTINPTLTAVGSGGANLLRLQAGSTDMFRVNGSGQVFYSATNTAGGTTGAQTINKPSGTVNFAATASTLVVTNSLVSTSSIVTAVVRTADTTAYVKNVVPASGSFTITLGAAATAETSVGFVVYN